MGKKQICFQKNTPKDQRCSIFKKLVEMARTALASKKVPTLDLLFVFYFRYDSAAGKQTKKQKSIYSYTHAPMK